MSKPVITSPSGGLIIEDPSDDEMEEDYVAPLPFLMRHHPSLEEDIPTVYEAFRAKSLSSNININHISSTTENSNSSVSLSTSIDPQFLSSTLTIGEEEESKVVIVLDCANLG